MPMIPVKEAMKGVAIAEPEVKEHDVDLLIVGGGMGACGTAFEAVRWGDKHGLKMMLCDKAALERSGAVAQGLSAINTYLGKNTADDYVRMVRTDLMGLVREDLIFDVGRHVDDSVHLFEEWGLPCWIKDENGHNMNGAAAKAADFARRHGVPRSYTDADALIADPGVDIVYVATPPDSHRELALKVLAAGKPVYVEKPMAMNHAECLDMIAAAERSGQRLFVAYYRRALPYFLKVKELLDSGAVGEVLSVEVRYFRPESPEDRDPARLPWRLRREVGGEGYFCDMAPHTLNILDFLLGEIADARGCKTNRGGFYDVADTVAASFRFRSGMPGTGMWCFVAPPSAAEDSVVVTGRKGSVRFSTFDFTPVELVTARGVERFEISTPEHIQGPLIETIVRELRGEGVCPSTGVSAARTSRVMDEIMKE